MHLWSINRCSGCPRGQSTNGMVVSDSDPQMQWWPQEIIHRSSGASTGIFWPGGKLVLERQLAPGDQLVSGE